MGKLEEVDYWLLEGRVPTRIERAIASETRPDKQYVTCRAEVLFDDDPDVDLYYVRGQCKAYADVYVEGFPLCKKHAKVGTVTGDIVGEILEGRYDKGFWSRKRIR